MNEDRDDWDRWVTAAFFILLIGVITAVLIIWVKQ
jgi:cbb3-type cytochrome oxidase subunit 3